MKKNNNILALKTIKINIFLFISIFINIFLALPLFIYSVFKKKYSSFLGALILSINAYYFIPYKNSDLYRYYEIMKSSQKISVLFRQQNDTIIEIFIKKILELEIPYNFIAFVSCFICYYYFFKSFKLCYNSKLIKAKIYLIYFCMYFFTIPLTAFHGLRFYPAVAIFTYGVLKRVNLKNKLGYIYILFSFFVHSSLLIGGIIFIFSEILFKYKINKIKWLIYLSFMIGLLINTNIYTEIIKNITFIPLNTRKYILVYLEGSFGKEYVQTISYEAKIAHYLFWVLRVLILFSLTKIRLVKNNLRLFVYLMICVVFIFLKFNTLYERYFYILIYISLLNQKKINMSKLKISSLLYFIGIFFNNLLLITMFFRTQYINIAYSYERILNYNILTILYYFFK